MAERKKMPQLVMLGDTPFLVAKHDHPDPTTKEARFQEFLAAVPARNPETGAWMPMTSAQEWWVFCWAWSMIGARMMVDKDDAERVQDLVAGCGRS